MTESQRQDLLFHTGAGIRLAAHLYLPASDVDEKLGIVFCHGLGGLKEVTPVGLATAMVERGYTVLAFDYRGFGGSDGIRGRVEPLEQVEDAVCAVEFLTQCRSDLHSIGIYGNSFGGGIALMAAHKSSRVKVGFVSVPVTSGSNWLRSVHRYHEYVKLKERALEALARKTVDGIFEMAERFTIVPPDPSSRERHKVQQLFTLESAFHIMNHEPIEIADQIKIPFGIIGIKTDLLVPFEQSEELYRKLSGPKELYAFPFGDHHSIYDECGLLSQVSEQVISWFDRYLNVSADGTYLRSPIA